MVDNTQWDTWLVGEHEMIERAMDVLRRELEKLPSKDVDPFALNRALDFLVEFGDKVHNIKEETYLFPLLIQRGIPESGPIRVMLYEHQMERDLLQKMMTQVKTLNTLLPTLKAQYRDQGLEYLAIRAEHIWKENDVLYMMGRQAFDHADKGGLLAGFSAINQATYGQDALMKFDAMLAELEAGGKVRKSLVENLSIEQIDALMESLPVEVTFVDANDTVAYFNRLDKEKIFPRTRSVVGRKVEKCHPAHSVDRVLEIVQGFKDGTLDKAEFWINFAGDKVLIQYVPVRDVSGVYLGTVEITQKIGAIQRLSGEKRLLNG
ncbi:MAG: PAS domain-containing protein [Anaerolineae bacterium]|nr:PAS domain-containing protein [Anaerolineae bacterium]